MIYLVTQFIRPYPPAAPPSSFVAGLREVTASGQRASVPLGELLDISELEAELLVPVDAPSSLLRAPIVSVPVVDLADPRPHLTGSELLLTTGLGFVDDDAWYRDYVEALQDAGTVALGFGIEPVFDAVPAGLVGACTRAGMPLVAFPPHIPFVHITTAFYAALEEARMRRLERLNALALAMMHAALGHSPTVRVVNALARYLGGIAIVEQGDDRAVAGTIDGLAVQTVIDALPSMDEYPDAPDEVPAHRTVRVTIESAGVDVLSGTVRSSRARVPARSRLSIAAPRQLNGTDLTAFRLAIDTLRLVHSSGAAASTSVDTLLMGLVVDALMRPDPVVRERTARLLRSALAVSRSGGVFAVAGRRIDGEAAHAADLAWWRTDLATPFVDVHDRALRAITATAPRTATREALAAAGWNIHVIGPLTPTELPLKLADAVLLAASGADEQARWQGLAALPEQRAAARRLLAPFEPAPQGAELRATLHTWLQHHGAWDATARALSVHRNVVRRQIAECASLLRADLDDARMRAELLLALDALAETPLDD